MWRMRVHGDYGKFRMAVLYTTSSPNTPKVFKHAWRTPLKSINVFGEYANSISPYMENTPIDIKVSISRQNFDQIPKNSDPKSP
jgi:hypothetical protein